MTIKDIVKTALQNVTKDYWGYDYYNVNALSSDYPNAHKKLDAYISQFEERVLCYELYHQMRVLLAKDNDVSSKVLLHGEIGKNQLKQELASLIGVESLSSRFVPDFLFHDPYSTDAQLMIVEVKTSHSLKFGKTPDEDHTVLRDLAKISNFIQKYKYQTGIFIATHISKQTMLNWIQENNDAIKKYVPKYHNIIIFTQEYPDSQVDEILLG